MHTARQLNEELFTISIDGQAATRADLFPEWDPLDRFGVVIHEAFGTIGASYLLQLAITAFYDARPTRRDRDAPVYPDVFVFHVGGRFGDHASFDVFPSRKEIFVDNDPVAILNAINDRGITRLAVPDRPVEAAQFEWKEPQQAIDRIVSTWAYSPTGRAENADVEISASAKLAEANTKVTLHPKQSYMEMQKAKEAIGAVTVPETERFGGFAPRGDEVSEEIRDQIRDARLELDDERGRTESYRRIDIRDALGMLHRGDAPAFESPVDFNDLLEDVTN